MTDNIRADLSALAKELHQLEFFTVNAHSHHARQLIQQAIVRLESHLIAREKDLDAPLVAVLAGPTGAGKSSLLNTLVGQEVSAVSVRRPTTSRPLLLHHPDDELWFAAGRILGNFERIRVSPDQEATRVPPQHTDRAKNSGSKNSVLTPIETPTSVSDMNPDLGQQTGLAIAKKPQLEIRSNKNMVPSVALIDAPDLDSVYTNHQSQAQDLLQAADLWIFVTTAARYGDALPWEFLATAAKRNLVVAVVLNRVPTGALLEIKQDLSKRLERLGLAAAPLFTIRQDTDRPDGFLPAGSADPIKQWLETLSGDALMRSAIARQSLLGSVRDTLELCESISTELATQDEVVQIARTSVDEAQQDGEKRFAEIISDGTLLRGEVLARWHELVGTTEIIKGAQSLGQKVLSRIERFWQGSLPSVVPVEKAVGQSISNAVVVELERFFTQISKFWQENDDTAYLAQQWQEPNAKELMEQAIELTTAWQRYIIDMLRSQGADKNKMARRLALGINAIAISLMLVIFASTAGLTGLEVGVAGASAVVAQKLLELIFGQQTINAMVKNARGDLLRRFAELNSQYSEEMKNVIGDPKGREQSKKLNELVEELKLQWHK